MKKIIFKVVCKNKERKGRIFQEMQGSFASFEFNNKENLVTINNVKESDIGYILELMDKYYLVEEYSIQEVNTVKEVGIQGAITRLLKTASWVIQNKSVEECEIKRYIESCENEIRMHYNRWNTIKFEVGDIVECNFGQHLKGELNGFINSIVCNISETGIPYVVPIMDVKTNYKSYSYLDIDYSKDVIYYEGKKFKKTLLLNKGKEINPIRFNRVVGRLTPEFLEKVIVALSTTFYFNKSCEEALENQNSKVAEEVASIIGSNLVAKSKRISYTEIVLMEAIGDALNNLELSKTVEEQLEDFFLEIGMTTKEKLMNQAFVIACKVDDITYEKIVLELQKIYPKLQKGAIRKKLQECFTDWLCNKQPELAEKRPKLSLMFLLKVFAKRMA